MSLPAARGAITHMAPRAVGSSALKRGATVIAELLVTRSSPSLTIFGALCLSDGTM